MRPDVSADCGASSWETYRTSEFAVVTHGPENVADPPDQLSEGEGGGDGQDAAAVVFAVAPPRTRGRGPSLPGDLVRQLKRAITCSCLKAITSATEPVNLSRWGQAADEACSVSCFVRALGGRAQSALQTDTSPGSGRRESPQHGATSQQPPQEAAECPGD
ncbi:hypothetical protein DIPPA_27925 [Diplonema papillatum]|nr:hypothetical protein DIPPA_27925 [Diplonema papillatum]